MSDMILSHMMSASVLEKTLSDEVQLRSIGLTSGTSDISLSGYINSSSLVSDLSSYQDKIGMPFSCWNM